MVVFCINFAQSLSGIEVIELCQMVRSAVPLSYNLVLCWYSLHRYIKDLHLYLGALLAILLHVAALTE